jgi:hypothetical protein
MNFVRLPQSNAQYTWLNLDCVQSVEVRINQGKTLVQVTYHGGHISTWYDDAAQAILNHLALAERRMQQELEKARWQVTQ